MVFYIKSYKDKHKNTFRKDFYVRKFNIFFYNQFQQMIKKINQIDPYGFCECEKDILWPKNIILWSLDWIKLARVHLFKLFRLFRKMYERTWLLKRKYKKVNKKKHHLDFTYLTLFFHLIDDFDFGLLKIIYTHFWSHKTP